jgi:hypothetical protein
MQIKVKEVFHLYYFRTGLVFKYIFSFVFHLFLPLFSRTKARPEEELIRIENTGKSTFPHNYR